MLKEIEKRKFNRISLSLPLQYRIRGSPEFGSSVTKDISMGGLRFFTDRYIRPLTDISLEIDILSKIINPKGRIRWSQPIPHSDRHQVGVEFIELEPDNKNYLSDYINMRLTYI